MTCTRFSLNSRSRSASPRTVTGDLPLVTAGGLPFLRPHLYVHPLVEFLNTPLGLLLHGLGRWPRTRKDSAGAFVKVATAEENTVHSLFGSHHRRCCLWTPDAHRKCLDRAPVGTSRVGAATANMTTSEVTWSGPKEIGRDPLDPWRSWTIDWSFTQENWMRSQLDQRSGRVRPMPLKFRLHSGELGLSNIGYN